MKLSWETFDVPGFQYVNEHGILLDGNGEKINGLITRCDTETGKAVKIVVKIVTDENGLPLLNDDKTDIIRVPAAFRPPLRFIPYDRSGPDVLASSRFNASFSARRAAIVAIAPSSCRNVIAIPILSC
jgi:hypothetical protein